jgi:hypothetical protein
MATGRGAVKPVFFAHFFAPYGNTIKKESVPNGPSPQKSEKKWAKRVLL